MMHHLHRSYGPRVLSGALDLFPIQCITRRWQSKKVHHIKIDRSGLYHPQPVPQSRTVKPGLTPLAKELISVIKARGPLTIHEFMSQALNNSKYGYYQTKNAKIGTTGDFITSPEISQLFGELIGVWCVSTWHSMGKPSKVNLIELGPGKGTLMSDLLRATASFPDFQRAVNVHFVEMSIELRHRQQHTLGCVVQVNDQGQWSAQLDSGIPVRWHTFLREVEPGPMLLVAQEFLDAFPVHQFEYTENGWRERLVDVDESAEGPFNFRIVLSKTMTPAVQALLNLAQAPNQPTPKVGSGIEVNPLSLALAEDISARLKQHGGAAMFIDYGENFSQNDTIRGFKQHKQVHFLEEPGSVDLTADVDFLTLAHIVNRQGMNVLGPVEQGAFLQQMGIGPRLETMIQEPHITDSQAQALVNDAIRLIDPQQMGARYKAIAFTNLEKAQIAGFDQVEASQISD